MDTYMKTIFCMACCCFFATATVGYGQTSDTQKKSLFPEDEDLPIMYQFEPNYMATKTERREALLEKIHALDTLPISEKKRLKLIKALYKDLNSEKFNKTMLANTHFEDETIEQ